MPRAKANREQRRVELNRSAQRRNELAGYAAKHNEKMRHAVARQVSGYGPTPKIRDLCRTVGLSSLNVLIKAANAEGRTVDFDTLLNTAKAAMMRWTKKRRALERAMDAKRIVLREYEESKNNPREGSGTYKVMRLCIGVRTTQANIKLHGAVPIALDYMVRSQLRHCLIVEVETKTLPDNITQWVRKELTHSAELGLWYCKPERIANFVQQLRVHLRSISKENNPFKLMTFKQEEEAIPVF